MSAGQTVPAPVLRPMLSNNVGQLQGRPGHDGLALELADRSWSPLRGGVDAQQIQRTGGGTEDAGGHARVAGGGVDAAMAE